MRHSKRILRAAAWALAVLIVLCLAGCGNSSDLNGDDLNDVLQKACSYTVDEVGTLDASEESSAWLIFGCDKANADALTDEYYDDYYDNVRLLVKNTGGVLSEDRYTAYERVSIAVETLGADPEDVEGYDLMAPVDDYEKVCAQGINAEIYALISANYVGYDLKNEREYLDDILDAQVEDGGISFDGKSGDLDITAMAVQALSFYQEDKEVQAVIAKARDYLSSKQGKDGDYGNCETTAQVIMALACLKEDPGKAEDFIKEGKSLTDGLMLYWTGTAFCHKQGDEEDLMATQQAILAMDGILAAREGKSLFEK